jgi:hypothetical protein
MPLLRLSKAALSISCTKKDGEFHLAETSFTPLPAMGAGSDFLSSKEVVMKQRWVMLRGVLTVLLCLGLVVGSTAVVSAGNEKPVNIMLKNDSSGAVQVEMIDQYGGNVTVTVEPGTSQNHAVKLNSAVKAGGKTVLKATAKDEGKEVVVGR